MSWRVAFSLDHLLAQINAFAPHRSTVSDGAIGDAAHATRASDHNPWVHDPSGEPIVTARDFTHDPAGGFDAYAFADRLLASQDARLKYVISNHRIGSGPAGPAPGVWRPYTGINAHAHHTHVSVVSSFPGFDQTQDWAAVGVSAPAPTPTRVPVPPPPPAAAVPPFPGVTRENIHAVTAAARAFQARLRDRGWKITVDGVHGPGTTAVLKAYQAEKHLAVDGVGGEQTWHSLWTAPL